MLRLPIPIFSSSGEKGKYYNEIEITRPKPSVIADTKKIADTGDYYTAVHTLNSGSITRIMGTHDDVSDKKAIRKLHKKMAYKSMEFVSLNVLLSIDDDDGVEGVYPCPLCKRKVIAKYVAGEDDDEEPQLDTRDHIHDLSIRYMEDMEESFEIELTEPVTIINAATKEVVESISKMEIFWPTVKHCISAYAKYGNSDDIRLQFAIYAEALRSINGTYVDDKWRRMFGVYLFENIPHVKKDFGKISKENNRYGLDPRIKKFCPDCGEFTANINTSNFFVSALRPL